MTENHLLSLIGVLFFLLMGIVAWVVSKAYDKLNEISLSLASLSASLHDRITNIDRRVTAVETTCRIMHWKDHDETH